MPNGAASGWTIQGWASATTQWRELDDPDDLLRQRLIQWLRVCGENPYRRARRDNHIPNHWYAIVPGSERDGRVVVCTYWIEERTKTVRADVIAQLRLPVP